MIIRKATPADVEIITEFNCRLAHETEPFELDRDVVRRGVRRGLEHSDSVEYFVAEVTLETGDVENANSSPPSPRKPAEKNPKRVIGQLMLTKEWSDWRDGWIMWLQSVYVDGEFRKSGVFDQLLQHVVDKYESDSDVKGFRLYVEKENSRARSVYSKRQFTDPHYLVLERLFDR